MRSADGTLAEVPRKVSVNILAPTNAPEVWRSTDFHSRLTAGSVLPQMTRLHYPSPFAMSSWVAQIDFLMRE